MAKKIVKKRNHGDEKIEKQLRSWLYGHYHIKLHNHIKNVKDLKIGGS